MSAYFTALAASPTCTEVILGDPDAHWFPIAKPVLGDKLTRSYTNITKLLEHERPKLCMVSMEARHAPTVIEAALDHGSHVFAEKPACTKPAQFRRLANLADSKHLHLMLALANRTNPETVAAARMIRQGQLGQLYGLDMHVIADQTRLRSKSYQSQWYADKDRAGGGHLAWLGIHWLDLAMMITGTRIESVAGFTTNIGGQPIQVEDSATATLRFSNRMLGTLTSGYYLDKGYHTQIRIWGEKGWLNIDSVGSSKLTWYLSSGSRAGEIQSFQGAVEPRGYSPFVDAVITAIARDTQPPIDTADSLHAIQCVYNIYRSATTGKTISNSDPH